MARMADQDQGSAARDIPLALQMHLRNQRAGRIEHRQAAGLRLVDDRLREIGVEKGLPSYLIADGGELDPAWLAGVKTVGLTAGASAPEELVLDVVEALRRHGKVEVEQMAGVHEDIEFRLPAGLRSEPSGAMTAPAAK
jgi:hypothetical protein